MADAATNGLGAFVNRLLLRSSLSSVEQEAILALPFQAVAIGRKRDFVHMDEEITYSSFVVSGLAARFGQTLDGKRQITAFHLPGEMADLHSAVRPIGLGGINALCDTVILRVPHSAIRKLAAHYPAIAEAFWRDCLLDAAVLMQWVINVGRRNATTRLAHLFCELAVRTGQNGDERPMFNIPITQEQLGDASALTGVHVNRSLRVLSDVVTLKDGWVTIHDWAKLARLGEFNGAYLTSDTGLDRQRRLLAVA